MSSIPDNSVSCPEARRTQTRRKKLKKKWTGKEWQQKRLEFIEKMGRKCSWCGSTEYLTVHHPSRNEYGTDAYMDFYLSGCVLLCRRCHQATHVGKVLCTGEHEDGENHYKYHDAEMCNVCFHKAHPEIKINAELKKQAMKDEAKRRRQEQAAKVKKWKKEHPTKMNNVNIKKKNGVS